MEKLHLFLFKQSIVLNRVINPYRIAGVATAGGGRGIAEAPRSVINYL